MLLNLLSYLLCAWLAHAGSNRECSCPPNFKLCINNFFKFRVLLPKARGRGVPKMACREKKICGRWMWPCGRHWSGSICLWSLLPGNPGYSGSARGTWNRISQNWAVYGRAPCLKCLKLCQGVRVTVRTSPFMAAVRWDKGGKWQNGDCGLPAVVQLDGSSM